MNQILVSNAKFPKLSRRVQYLKNDEGGDGTMCEIMEELVKEMSMESIRNLFENGCLLEAVVASFPNVLEEDIRAIYAEVSAKQ